MVDSLIAYLQTRNNEIIREKERDKRDNGTERLIISVSPCPVVSTPTGQSGTDGTTEQPITAVTEAHILQDWQRRPFTSCATEPAISEADVLPYLPNGTYSRQDYEQAYEAAKKAKGD